MKSGKYELSLLNAAGVEVYHSNVLIPSVSFETRIQLNDIIPAGIYVLKVTDYNSISKTQSLIISK